MDLFNGPRQSQGEQRASRYKKTGGAADGAGESYECKILTLVFLRMLAEDREFHLASNLEEAGLFDDIVVWHRKHSTDAWRVDLLQLKHKHNKKISKSALLGISGDFSLLKYCASFVTVRSSDFSHLGACDGVRFVIYTNASVHKALVDELESDGLFDTGGKTVSFKAGGEVYRELCEWVDFKETLAELHGQVDGLSDAEVGSRVGQVLQSVTYQNRAVTSFKEELLKAPTRVKLTELLKKLESVSDKATYASFLAELHVYSAQAHESQLDAKIKEEFAQVGLRVSDSLEAEVMVTKLKARVKTWWQKENVYLTRDSALWRDAVNARAHSLSRSTIDRLTPRGVEFLESSLQVLFSKIEEVAKSGGILNLRVDSRTAASSLKVHKALARFGARDLNVLHVNVKALLAREDDVLSAWATRWCPLLVVECDDELDWNQASRIGTRVLQVVAREKDRKLLVLIAPERHGLNAQLRRAENYTRFNDNVAWSDLVRESQETLLTCQVAINGDSSRKLADLLGDDKGFVNKADLEVISQLLTGDLHCGTQLDGEEKFFVTRQLLNTADGVQSTRVVNSILDVPGKVVLVVAGPGMGKSTLLAHLAKSVKKEHPSGWVVHIKLNDNARHLKALDVEHFDQVAARQFLERVALGSGDWFEKLLFESLERKLVVFIDGVDEVCPHYERQVFTLLGVFKDMKFAQLWVASRPVFRTKLEDILSVKTFSLLAFSRQNLREFFSNIWTANNPTATPGQCGETTDRLLTRLDNSLGKDNLILGVPLMAAMVAETFEDWMSAANFAEDDRHERLDVMSLYKLFVKKKFDLYCVEKKKATNRELAANIRDEKALMKQMHHNHRLAALRVLFSPEEISSLQFEGKEKFDEDLATYLQEVSDGREKMGIIDNVVDGAPHFVHRSFAEFFAAKWLAKHFRENSVLIGRILFDPAYGRVSDMFHRSLAETHGLHVAVLDGDVGAVRRLLATTPRQCDVDELDAGGRTPLHLTVLLRDTDRRQDWVTIVECLVREHKASLLVADAVLGWTPVRYAERTSAWEALEVMLLSRQDMGKMHLRPEPRAMLDAARDASTTVVRYLVKERGGRMNCRGLEGETMLHRAAEGQNAETVKYLLKAGQTVRYLLERVPDLDAVNNHGLTALQISAQKGVKEVMTVLLEAKASFKLKPTVKPSDAQRGAGLLCAAFAGSLEYVKTLVEMEASVLHRDDKGHTAAWYAASKGHVEIVDWLLLRVAEEGDTLLHAACRQGELEVVASLLFRGFDIEGRGCSDQTPLAAAAEKGHFAVVKLLLEKGASVNCRDLYRLTPLHSASADGHEQVAALLLRHGADVTAKDQRGRTALHAATWGKQLKLVELLLEGEALSSIECTDVNGWTPLHTAAIINELSVLTLLLEKGASVECRDVNGWTPLHAASSTGREQVAALLLRHGADVTAENHKGRTPLHTATWSRELELVDMLVEKGASVECQDKDGWTPLHIASTHEELATLELLLEKGASVERPDNNGCTPLHTASSSGYNEHAAALLLRHGADIAARDHSGRTALHAATRGSELPVMEMLLSTGANVECRDKEGWTPLLIATSKGLEQAAALLLRHGADVNVVDNNGVTLREVAAQRGESASHRDVKVHTWEPKYRRARGDRMETHDFKPRRGSHK